MGLSMETISKLASRKGSSGVCAAWRFSFGMAQNLLIRRSRAQLPLVDGIVNVIFGTLDEEPFRAFGDEHRT